VEDGPLAGYYHAGKLISITALALKQALLQNGSNLKQGGARRVYGSANYAKLTRPARTRGSSPLTIKVFCSLEFHLRAINAAAMTSFDIFIRLFLPIAAITAPLSCIGFSTSRSAETNSPSARRMFLAAFPKNCT
jgi:hypothetical protein